MRQEAARRLPRFYSLLFLALMPGSQPQEPAPASRHPDPVRPSSLAPPAAAAEPQVAAMAEEPTPPTGSLRVSQPAPEIPPPRVLASSSRRQDRISIKELAKRVWRAIDVDNVPGLAAQASYYFVLALFPFLIFLAALVGSLPFTGLWDGVLTWITHDLPPGSRHLILETVTGLMRGRHSFLSIGILGTTWAMCTGLMNLMCSLNTVYEVQETRSFWKRLGLAFVMLFVLTFLFVGSFGLLSAGDWLGIWVVNRASPSVAVIMLWFVGRWVLSLGLFAVAVAILEHVLPNLRRPWRCFSAGTLFVVLAWTPATLGFNVYIRHIASYNRTYGALGAFVILMLWMYITSFILLVGAEINSELRKVRTQVN
jgi:membrane protein